MSTCSKCGSSDRSDLMYGVCSICRKKLLNSIPLVNYNRADPPTRSSITKQNISNQKLIIRLTRRFFKNIEKNTLGTLSLIFYLVALIMIVIFLNTLLFAGAFSISAIVCSIFELELDWDENKRFIRYGFLIGVILSIISLWPLIYFILKIFL
ncbi:hypothetical protein LCGC14_0498240 [marine sediment metagenome]|uniref:Uncharacterized protein n=1 Tax=marine sediment metagenome TaxID=412755 RepID=A0A0F9S4M8_9ZZZZ|nr:hypothetical protein [bacterium]